MNQSTFELGNQLHKFGTVKRMYLYEKGFRIVGMAGEKQHLWHELQKIRYSWFQYTTNVFAFNHDFTLYFDFKDSRKDFDENWQPASIYINLPSKHIKKLLTAIQLLGVDVEYIGD